MCYNRSWRIRLHRRKRTLHAPYHPCHGVQLNIHRQATEATRASKLQADNSPPIATPRPLTPNLPRYQFTNLPSPPNPRDNRFLEKFQFVPFSIRCSLGPPSSSSIRHSSFIVSRTRRDSTNPPIPNSPIYQPTEVPIPTPRSPIPGSPNPTIIVSPKNESPIPPHTRTVAQ
jgi:hypothetical protein